MRLAALNRLGSEVFAVELEQIKGVLLGRTITTVADEQLEIRDALVVTNDRLTIDQAGSAAQASHGVGDYPEPLRPIVPPPRE